MTALTWPCNKQGRDQLTAFTGFTLKGKELHVPCIHTAYSLSVLEIDLQSQACLVSDLNREQNTSLAVLTGMQEINMTTPINILGN